jgi:hypothetical protein
MPKKRKKKTLRVPKSGPVWHRTAEEATLDRMPKFNAHACGTGVHGDEKYNRAKQKRSWQKELAREARNRGPLPFMQMEQNPAFRSIFISFGYTIA